MRTRPTTHRKPDTRRPAGLPGSPRFEVLPLPGITDEVPEHLPAHATVTVTASPRQGMSATIDCAVALALRGMHVVPHLSARLVPDEATLSSTLDTLANSGVEELFVVGGDAEQPVGEYTSALELLQAIAAQDHGFRIGVAGYPEPHPLISDDVAVQAMWDKREYASYIVSQMCFDARALLTWVRRVRHRGVDLPILVGLPGPASTSKLLRVGSKIGVGQSTRVLRKHRGGLRHLASPRPWRPAQLLRDLAPAFADPTYGLQGLHVYTFNDVATAGRWWQAAASDDQEATPTLDQ